MSRARWIAAIVAATLVAAALVRCRGSTPASAPPAPTSRAAAPGVDGDAGTPARTVPARHAVRARPIETVRREPSSEGTVNADEATPMASSPPSTETIDDDEETSPRWQRFNEDSDRYMRTVVAARVRSCWKQLDGRGKVLFRYTFRHETGRGVGTIRPDLPDGAELPVTIMETGLTPAQTQRALACMVEAVHGTSFDAELPYDDAGPDVVLFQDWQVGPPS